MGNKQEKSFIQKRIIKDGNCNGKQILAPCIGKIINSMKIKPICLNNKEEKNLDVSVIWNHNYIRTFLIVTISI